MLMRKELGFSPDGKLLLQVDATDGTCVTDGIHTYKRVILPCNEAVKFNLSDDESDEELIYTPIKDDSGSSEPGGGGDNASISEYETALTDLGVQI